MDTALATGDTPTLSEQSEEEEIEFVSEGPVRPIVGFVDLVSSDDEAHNSHLVRKVKDHIDRQKERVDSTLDRLARHVEVEKQQKAAKNKAFQEKLYEQHAHGLQELEFNKGHSDSEAARRCVYHWLKMPGLKPGRVNSGCRAPLRSTEQRSMNSQPILCPIMHCSRKFDDGHLLLGHLKRFDHSPCDPTITLHGTPVTSFACVMCPQRFLSLKECKDHISEKAGLADGHEGNVPPQSVQCFACPNCFLLFNLRDECLQHMSGSNHFLQAITLSDEKGTPCPIPIPSYAKKVLVSLCKDVPFQVLCTSCRRPLRSHVELTAHFRTQCRNAGPTTQSEKSIAEVAEIFRVKAHCPTCRQVLTSDTHIAKHAERTRHKVKIVRTMEESILAFCHINEGNKTPADFCLSAASSRLKPCILKRTFNNHDLPGKTLLKRKRESGQETMISCRPVEKGSAERLGIMVTSWFCECCQKFSTEQAAEKHIMAANRICHKCLVCSKLAEDLGIIHLHMSRFHGGAHLSNFIFWCRACSVDIPRKESVMAHVSACHGGHSYYYEQEDLEEEPSPSTSAPAQSPSKMLNADFPTMPGGSAKGKWQCHICEEMFDSKESVEQHCKSVNTHQFHKYSCDICKKRFHKIETLLRHSQHQHNGQIQVKHFCGLCEDLFFEQETDFHGHYEGFHSSEYGFVPDQTESPAKIQEGSLSSPIEYEDRLTCGCLENYAKKTNRKEDSSRCLASLLEKGHLWYSCCLCSATAQTLKDLKIHICKENTRVGSKQDFVVKCSTCSKVFNDTESAQQHYHIKHCFLQKPQIKDNFGRLESKSAIFTFTASGGCLGSKPVKTVPPCASRVSYEASTVSSRMEVSESLSAVESKSAREEMERQSMDTGEEESELPDLDFLRTMTHIVFVDLDNWANFFTHLPGSLNQGTFVWGFQGGKTNWKPPVKCRVFNYLSNTGSFFLHPRCSNRKDAADFAICMHAGRLDEQLPKQIPFTILSGDKGFLELETQFKKTQRPAHILNPHHIEGEMMCALLNSISDTTKDIDDDDDKMEIDEGENDDAEFTEAIKRSLQEM
ncbi:hypothetical protein FKM82_011127 [Ascaphus truei]